MSIPKIIHYCWFGGKPLPEELKKYIQSWKHYLPDYQIIEWNETNYDVTSNEFVKNAYELKKYAFVSDYVRLNALYEYGGVYLDTDVQVIRPFDEEILKKEAVFCFESEEAVMTAFMAVSPKNFIIEEFLKWYEGKRFTLEQMIPNTVALTDILEKHGLKINGKIQMLGAVKVYSNEYFNGFDFKNSTSLVTENTYTVHHCAGSWCSAKERCFFKMKKGVRKIFGEKVFLRLKKIKKRFFC